jgi:hypothetical protein
VGAGLTLSNSRVIANQAMNNETSNGGGISILNGSLTLDDDTVITNNITSGYGGGIVLLGSTGYIKDATINHNRAGQKGGGLAVEENTEDKLPSQATLINVEVTKAPQGSFWIGDNQANTPASDDILGKYQASSTSEEQTVIYEDTSEVNGSPASLHPPEEEPQYLGTVNLDVYCHTLYPPQTSLRLVPSTTSEQMLCEPLSGKQNVKQIDTQKACQEQYPQHHDVIDRLADYYDPSSWQCYAPERELGMITTHLDAYCQSKGYEGIYTAYDNAYEWQCRDKNTAHINIAIADACQWYYHRNDAIDRLANFNKPDGWECWAPE